MFKKIIPVLAVIAIFITACGPQGTPTMSPADVEGTAVSAAWTVVAMTQMAIPTATPVPPTETPSPTPLPTFTPLPLPTQDTTILPTATQAAAAGGADSCLKPLNVAEAGPTSQVRFENETGGTVTLSLNLSTNAFGQCGALVYTMGKAEKLILALPKGEYFAYAWITYPNGDTSNASGYVNNRVGDNHMFAAKIRKEAIIVP
ncbi:MAG: hypothetical protein IH588_11805 [Anaerolineales bacterium]|nr:hypothetical protein [Anaerolineales bacterium]